MTAIDPGPRVRLREERSSAKLSNVDWSLVAVVLAITGLGALAIFSATDGPGLALRQLGFLGVGLGLMGTMAMIDYGRLRLWIPGIIAASLVVLIAVLTPLGTERRGTQGWFVIGGFSIQPAEFAKIALIVVLAALFTGRTGGVDARRITASLVVLGVLSVLVLRQGETGSVLVYCAVALGVYLIAGVPARILWLLLASGIAVSAVIFTSGVLADYQRDRLTSFVDADAPAAYNQQQSVAAIGSGGLTGQGLFEGPQTQFGFVPAQETDFIFTVIAEELGFVGAATVLVLQGVILVRIFRIAQLARDGFGTLLCIGVFTMFLIHVVQNVGMSMRLMPITGIPLPFVSYGGSALLTALLGIGLVQSVSVHRRRGVV